MRAWQGDYQSSRTSLATSTTCSTTLTEGSTRSQQTWQLCNTNSTRYLSTSWSWIQLEGTGLGQRRCQRQNRMSMPSKCQASVTHETCDEKCNETYHVPWCI